MENFDQLTGTEWNATSDDAKTAYLRSLVAARQAAFPWKVTDAETLVRETNKAFTVAENVDRKVVEVMTEVIFHHEGREQKFHQYLTLARVIKPKV